MKKRILIAAGAIALAAILASVPFAFAQHSMMRHGDGAGGPGMMFLGHLGHLKSDLGLTDDQAAQIKTIVRSLRDQNAAYRDQMRGGMQQVAQALIKDPTDLAGAQAIIDQQTATENTMKKNALVAASKALQVLSSDQRVKLQTLVQNHIQNMESRHGLLR
jgi:Spy/CpxP family protein refolding chaperone